VSAFTDRLVQAAALPLVDHTPDDRHTDEAARKVAAAVLDVLVDDLEKWQRRIREGRSDDRAKAAQTIGLSLVSLKLVDAADEIRHPRSAPASQEDGNR
jgi:hypothetical protein